MRQIVFALFIASAALLGSRAVGPPAVHASSSSSYFNLTGTWDVSATYQLGQFSCVFNVAESGGSNINWSGTCGGNTTVCTGTITIDAQGKGSIAVGCTITSLGSISVAASIAGDGTTESGNWQCTLGCSYSGSYSANRSTSPTTMNGNQQSNPGASSLPDPVNIGTGSAFHEHTDILIPGLGAGLEFTRAYNSGASAVNGPLGFGWTFNYNAHLGITPATSTTPQEVTLVDETGQQSTFIQYCTTPPSTGCSLTYSSPPGVFATLVEQAGPPVSFILTRKDQSKLSFSSTGQLTQIADRNNNATTLGYDGSNNLSTATDPAGRALTFAFDTGHTPNRMTKVTETPVTSNGSGVTYTATTVNDTSLNVPTHALPGYLVTAGASTGVVTDNVIGQSITIAGWSAGKPADGTAYTVTRSVSFSYDSSSNLQQVTDVRGGVTTYGYSSHYMTSLTDANNHLAVTQVYDSATPTHRVVEQYGAGAGAGVTYGASTLADTSKAFVNLTNDVVYADGQSRTISSSTATQITVGSAWSPAPASGAAYTVASPQVVASGGASVTYGGNTLIDGSGSPSWPVNSLAGDIVVDGAKYGIVSANASSSITLIGNWPGGAPSNGTAYSIYTVVATGGGATCLYYSSGTTHTSANCPGAPAAPAVNIGCTESAGSMTTSVVDPRGALKDYYFDSAYRTTEILDQWSGSTSAQTLMCYDSNNDLLSTTDPDGNKTSSTYDQNGNVLTRTDAMTPGNQWTFIYDGMNDLLTVTAPPGDPVQGQTTYGYDTSGNLISVKQADSETSTTLSYTCLARNPVGNGPNGNGELMSVTESTTATLADCSAGNTTTFGYDAYGDRNRVVDARFNAPQTPASTFLYDPSGRLITATDEMGNTTSYTYDAQNNVTSVTDPLGNLTQYAYDNKGNLTQVTDAKTNPTHYTYDAADRLILVTDATSNHTSYSYDANNNRISSTDPNLHTTSYGFDALNRVAAITQPPSNGSSYTYKSNGQPTVLENDPNGFTTSYAYDLASNLQTRIDANGVATSYQYDPDNRLTHINYSDGTTPNVTYAYFNAGTRETMQLSTDTHPTSYQYDAVNRLTSVTFPGSQVVGYHYDSVGNRDILTYPDLKQVHYTYWADHLMQTATDWASRTTSYTYYANGELYQTARSNGVTSTYSFDTASRLTGIAQPDTATSTAASIGYGTPDAVGNWPSRTQGGNTDSYTYDPLYRLTGVQYSGGNCQSYSYDAAGNRNALVAQLSGTCPTNPTPNNIFDNANRLESTGSSSTPMPYTFDANGSQVGAGNTAYVYDAENRMIAAHGQPPGTGGIGASCLDLNNDGIENGIDLNIFAASFATNRGQANFNFRADMNWDGIINGIDLNRFAKNFTQPCQGFQGSYTYNGDGLRVSKTENGATTSYVWDVASGLPAILQDSQGDTYEYGQGLILQDNAGTPSWYLQDGLGSTVGLTNNAGALTATYSYDVYGAVTSTTGSPTATFTFDGEQTDASGLIYLRARYDDPSTGRFVTQDPFVDRGTNPQALNRYVYGLNGPTNLSDPYGLFPCPGCGKIKRVASRIGSGIQSAVQAVVEPVNSFFSSCDGKLLAGGLAVVGLSLVPIGLGTYIAAYGAAEIGTAGALAVFEGGHLAATGGVIASGGGLVGSIGAAAIADACFGTDARASLRISPGKE